MAYDIFENFAFDEDLEIHGAWHELAPGSRIKVARIDNPTYQAAMYKGMRENESRIRVGDDATEEQKAQSQEAIKEVLKEAVAEGLLKDYEGLTYNKKTLKYSKANSLKMLQHKDFLELVLKLANDTARFRLKAEEDLEKNS